MPSCLAELLKALIDSLRANEPRDTRKGKKKSHEVSLALLSMYLEFLLQ